MAPPAHKSAATEEGDTSVAAGGGGGGCVLAPRQPPGAFWPRALPACLALTDTPDQSSDAGHGDDECHEQCGGLLVTRGGQETLDRLDDVRHGLGRAGIGRRHRW